MDSIALADRMKRLTFSVREAGFPSLADEYDQIESALRSRPTRSDLADRLEEFAEFVRDDLEQYSVADGLEEIAAALRQHAADEREFSSRSEERRVMAMLKETREINRQLIEVLRKIILKAPAWGPLWYGSEEMKAARKIINPEESR